MMTERGDETPSGRMRQLTRERCLCYHTLRSGGGHPLNHPRCIWSWAGVPNEGVVPRRVVQPKSIGRARWAGHFQSGTSERRSRIELSGKPLIFKNQSEIRELCHVSSRGAFSYCVLIRALSGAS